MLVCPQCQFENPDTNKFCQKCGISLTEVVCPTCGAVVPLNVELCPHCGTKTGIVWRAILSVPSRASEQSQNSTAKKSSSQTTLASEPTVPLEDVSESNLVTSAAQYLDSQHRYQVLETLLKEPSEPTEDLEIRVLDCQPYQPTYLQALQKQLIDGVETATLAEGLLDDSDLATSNVRAAFLKLTQTYLSLQTQSYPSFPQIHDAWDQDGEIVILLADRADLPELTQVWTSQGVLPLQILHWFHQMTELWDKLQAVHGCQSLLKPTNLRIDEDQLLCLQRLFLDEVDYSPSLQDLGQLWQSLLQQSQQPQLEPIVALSQQLATGAIATVDQLRSQFESIAAQFQPHAPMPTMPSKESSLSKVSELDEDNEPTVELSPQLKASIHQIESTSSETDISTTANSTRLEFSSPEDNNGDGDDVPTVVLPMKLINIEDVGRSDVGRQRDHNEDYFSILTEVQKLETPNGRALQVKGLYILCDGMGGHAGGEIASGLAVDTLRKYFETHWTDQLPTEEIIREAIYLANKTIYDLNQQYARSGSGRMGTTLVLVLIQDTHVAIAHVGDSRLYRFSRRRGLEQLTIDHEVGQREIQRGVEPAIAYARPDAYQLTQALGPRDENFISPDVQFLELNEDLLLLLCSDGLTDNNLLETHWRTHLEPLLSIQSNLEQGVNQLIDLANQHNGHDNITAVVIRTRVRPNLEQLKR
jgi:protein phosphatase